MASVVSGLKRLEEEKLTFLTGGNIASKFSNDDIAKYSAMAPMDEQVIDSLVGTVDETDELKSIAAMPAAHETCSDIGDGTSAWCRGDVSAVSGGNATLSFGLPFHGISREPTCHELSMRPGHDIPNVEAVDALNDIQEISPDMIEDAEVEEVDVDHVEASASSKRTTLWADDGLNGDTVYDDIQNVDDVLQPISDSVYQSLDNSVLPKNSVYQSLAVEKAETTDESSYHEEYREVSVVTAAPEPVSAIADTVAPPSAVLRHDFQAAERVAVPENATALEKLKAQGVFNMSRVHAEVSRNIDALILDEFLPRAEFETYHGQSVEELYAMDHPDDPKIKDWISPTGLRAYSNIDAESLMHAPSDSAGLDAARSDAAAKPKQDSSDSADASADAAGEASAPVVAEANEPADQALVHVKDSEADPDKLEPGLDREASSPNSSALAVEPVGPLAEANLPSQSTVRKIDMLATTAENQALPTKEVSVVSPLAETVVGAVLGEDAGEGRGTSDKTCVRDELRPEDLLPPDHPDLEETLVLEEGSEVRSAIGDEEDDEEGATVMEERPSLEQLNAAMAAARASNFALAETIVLAEETHPTKTESTKAVSEEKMREIDNEAVEDERTMISPALDYESLVGAVAGPAPDNEHLAKIAGQIAPKTTSESVCVAMSLISQEIACPYNAADEKRNDDKMLNSLEEDGSDEHGSQRVSSKSPAKKRPNKTRQLKLTSFDAEGSGYHEDTLGSLPKMAPRKSLVDCDAVKPIKFNKVKASDMDQSKNKWESGERSISLSSVIWAVLMVLIVVGILYLLYMMGLFAELDPRLDPRPRAVVPKIVSAPSYNDSPLAIRAAVEEASKHVQAAADFDAYFKDDLKAKIGAIELNDPEAKQKTLALNLLGHEMYPDDMSFALDYVQTLLGDEKLTEARAFIDALPEEQREADDVRDLRWQTFTADAHFNPGIQTIHTTDFDALSPLGGGSTVTFKFIQNGEKVAAFKPLQINKQSNYRAEIAAWRLCEMVACDFNIPYNKEIRIDYDTFNTLYSRSKSSNTAAYRAKFSELTWTKDPDDNKRYLYGTYKDWVPDFTRFPIELTSVWRSWFSAEKPVTQWSELSTALSPYTKNAHTKKLYTELLAQAKDLTTEKLAAQISEVLVFDYLLGNWDRFSGVPEWWGVNCQFKDGAIVSIDNGAGFQWGANEKVTERYLMVERFSRHFVENLRHLEQQNTCDMLFPNPTQQDVKSCNQFFKQLNSYLTRVDALIIKYGEDAVLAFP